MIALHSITKVLGRGAQETVVLDEVDWVIQARTHYVILGQRGSGKSTLLDIISGTRLPTSGWVERRGIVSPTNNVARYASSLTTVRHLAAHLSLLYRGNAEELAHFVARFADLDHKMDTPVRQLKPIARQMLNLAFFYGLPCDFYLFDGRVDTRIPEMKEKCREALRERKKHAGSILVTSVPRIALEFGGIPGILFRGKVRFFNSLDVAINTFERLPVADSVPQDGMNTDDRSIEEK